MPPILTAAEREPGNALAVGGASCSRRCGLTCLSLRIRKQSTRLAGPAPDLTACPWTIVRLILAHPLLSDEELAGLLSLEQKSVRSSLSTLHTLGCLEPISTSVSHVASPSSSNRQLVFHRHAEKEVT
jgi:hypothetical protein